MNWDGWAITYLPYNFNNPTMGAVYSQLYVRQALQHLVDQDTISDVVWHGAANPGYGPVPQDPDNKFLSDEQRDNPYPFDPDAATTLLEDNGWTLGSDGVYVCETGADCGEGIEDGQALSITILTQSGNTETDNMFAAMKSTFEESGVGVTIKEAPLNTVLGSIPSCESDSPECTWELPFFGTAGSWYFPAYPTGEQLFSTGGGSNFGSYSDAEDGRAHPEHPRRGRRDRDAGVLGIRRDPASRHVGSEPRLPGVGHRQRPDRRGAGLPRQLPPAALGLGEVDPS